MPLPEKLTLPSGAILTLCEAPFETSMQLLKVTAKELGQVTTGIKLEANLATDPAALSKLMSQDLTLDLLKNAVCQIIGSDAFEGVLSACMQRCLYNNQAINRETFEKREARQDYLPAAWEVIKHNLLPFFAGLKSKSLTAGSPAGEPPK